MRPRPRPESVRPRPQCLMNHATYKYITFILHIMYHKNDKTDISQTELT